MASRNKPFSSMWQDLYGVAFEQRFIDAGGIRTRVLHAGETGMPPLILIHGTGGHAEAYVRNLAAHGEKFDTYAIDLVGHGLSAKPESRYEIADYVDHVRRIMDVLGFERASLSGESLGGWVAARFALTHPGRVQRMVLNTTGGATLDLAVMRRISELTMAAVSDPTWERIKARLEWLMADPSRVTDDMVACRQRIYQQPGMVEVTQRILCLQDPEIRQRNNLADEEWAAIRAPTLVLWTSHDPTAATTVGRRIADLIPNAWFEVMDGCGHWPQFEDPDTFNRLHTGFLAARAH